MVLFVCSGSDFFTFLLLLFYFLFLFYFFALFSLLLLFFLFSFSSVFVVVFVVVVIIIIIFAVLEYFEKTHQGVYLGKQSVSLETGKDQFIYILQTVEAISSDLFRMFSLVRLHTPTAHLAIYKSRILGCLVDFNNNDNNNL